MVLDWRNRADVAIIIAAAAIIAIVFGTIIISWAIVVIGFVIRVPTVISIIVFVRGPGA
jgi:hypothetical protein